MATSEYCKEKHPTGITLLGSLKFLEKEKNKEIFIQTFDDLAKYASKLSVDSLIKHLKEN